MRSKTLHQLTREPECLLKTDDAKLSALQKVTAKLEEVVPIGCRYD